MFLEKYRPKSIAVMVGNRFQASELKRAIAGWKCGSALILSGPPGCGKSLAIELVAKELGFEVVAGTFDDLLAASRQTSIWARGKVLVGDLDYDVSAGDVAALVKESSWPVVLVTGDIYQRNLAELRKDRRMSVISFQKIGEAELAGLLKQVCDAENIVCSERALYELAQRSDGDVRWGLTALESLKVVDAAGVQELDKDRIEKIFGMLDAVFQRRADFDASELFAWIAENLPERYSGAELAQAYRCVATAARFQRSGLDKHSQELLKLLPVSRISAQYRPPRWLNTRPAALAGVHCSAKKARAYFQVINSLQRNKDGA